MEVLCIGSAVIDIAASPVGGAESWQEKQRIDSIRFLPGGDAANQCVRLADEGVKAGALFAVGDDPNGAMLTDLLKNRGVDTGLVAVKTDCATGTAIVLVSETGERHTFSVRGAHSLFDAGDLPKPESGWADELKALSVASFFSLPLLEERGLEEFLRSVKEKGALIFADLGADKLHLGLDGISRFLPYVDYFLPSLYDARDMTGCTSPEEIAEVYKRCGCENIVIKLGAEGCYYRTAAESGYVRTARVMPVDTTGAGDCMAALFISRILKGDGVREALRYACAGATLSTLHMGASKVPLKREEILSLMKTISGDKS